MARPAHLSTTPEAYARKLIAKHGLARADRIANDRESAAQTEASALFYSRVMTVIDRAMTGGLAALAARSVDA